MKITFGDYELRVYELEYKLSIQVTSHLGEVHFNEEDHRTSDFPHEICFYIQNQENMPEAQGLKAFNFGEYSFIMGVNFLGELFLFHPANLYVGKKLIDGIDSVTLAFLKEPKES